jgi:RNA polymerase sigma-70 factor (ECF subfamily)
MSEEEATQQVSSLYESWYAIVFRYAARLAGRVDIAEEVVQEAFIQLYQGLVAGKQIRNPRAWTFCVVRRQVGRRLGHFRRDRDRYVPLETLDILPAGHVGPYELESEAERIQTYFSVLARREEEVILLRLAGMRYREIADELGITISSVNTLLVRALRKLKIAIKLDELTDSSSHETADRTPKTLQ